MESPKNFVQLFKNIPDNVPEDDPKLLEALEAEEKAWNQNKPFFEILGSFHKKASKEVHWNDRVRVYQIQIDQIGNQSTSIKNTKIKTWDGMKIENWIYNLFMLRIFGLTKRCPFVMRPWFQMTAVNEQGKWVYVRPNSWPPDIAWKSVPKEFRPVVKNLILDFLDRSTKKTIFPIVRQGGKDCWKFDLNNFYHLNILQQFRSSQWLLNLHNTTFSTKTIMDPFDDMVRKI